MVSMFNFTANKYENVEFNDIQEFSDYVPLVARPLYLLRIEMGETPVVAYETTLKILVTGSALPSNSL